MTATHPAPPIADPIGSDGADHRGMERRQCASPSQSPLATLTNLPALVILERLPIAVLATSHDGTILFANGALAAMLGLDRDAIVTMNFHDIFPTLPAEKSAIHWVQSYAGRLVELMHADGYAIRVTLSQSILRRRGEAVALTVCHDLTEQLWTTAPPR